ncbi:hypothetical protein S7711_00035 [Stachybotrys chartarum IBT 7711]|uniref:Uncharacterized protein n=1 Tax=Stachybotrys chartarum (strain CBS 109288 / IBT 7711) TaxID=1280523 RepID=A0A084B387_STACB|nr:hypothetical protein S7711_00035 [Stachybotrys chartarum IBT 7711]
MESFSSLRRRTTDLLLNVHQNVQQNVASLSSPRKPAGMNGTWEPIAIPPVSRALHSLDVISGTAYVFGGQNSRREPADNDMHVVTLPFSTAAADYHRIKATAPTPEDLAVYTEEAQTTDAAEDPAQAADAQEEVQEKDLDEVPLASPQPSSEAKFTGGKGKERATDERPALGNVPEPRFAHATAVIGSRIFLFGGVGGTESRPLEEAGRVWIFDTRNNKWTYLDPAPAIKGGSIVLHPGSRGYHCATAVDKPRDFAPPARKKPQNWQEWAVGDISKTGIPQNPIVGHVAEEAVDQEEAGYGTFFVHGGVLAGGERANDLWAFDVRTRTWTELPAAPGPGRSGASICISKSRLFRFGGFDGESELGGQIDFLHLEVEMFDDKVTRGEVSISARSGWQSLLENNVDASSSEVPLEPGQTWPLPRSGAVFQPLSLGGGAEYLILAMGESEPSSENGPGRFHDDVWAFQVPPLGMTAASFTAAMLQAVGRKTGEGKWTRLNMVPYDDDNYYEDPQPRGWLASAPMGDLDETGVVLWGGVGADGSQLGDGWILRLGDTRTSY